MLVKHMRCDFSIDIEEMLKDEVDVLIYRVSILIDQGSGVLVINRCDIFLSWDSPNRKDLFEGPNQFFVLCFHCNDNELSSAS